MVKVIGLDTRLRARAETLLVKALVKRPPVKASLQKIAKEFHEMIDVPFMKFPPFEDKDPFPLERKLPPGIDRTRVEEYALELRKLADDYNLRCDWIIGKLHTQIRHLIDPGFRILHPAIRIERVPVTIDHIGVDYNNHAVQFPVTLSPQATWTELEREVKRAWIQAKEIMKTWSKEKRYRSPSQLQLHVDWLYQSVVLHKTSLQIYSDLTEEAKEDADCKRPETIKGEINRLAKMLGIPLRRGRPPGSKKV